MYHLQQLHIQERGVHRNDQNCLCFSDFFSEMKWKGITTCNMLHMIGFKDELLRLQPQQLEQNKAMYIIGNYSS